MKNEIKLVVRNIIGDSIDGYSRVTVSNEVFNAVRGIKPTLPYRGQGDLAGKGVRVFSFNGVELCAQYDKDSRKTMFLMKTDEAEAHLLTIAQERDKAEKLPFNSNLWERNVVATA